MKQKLLRTLVATAALATAATAVQAKPQDKYATNNGVNHLHGGKVGFNKVLWTGEANEASNSVTLTYVSKDGEEGYWFVSGTAGPRGWY